MIDNISHRGSVDKELWSTNVVKMLISPPQHTHTHTHKHTHTHTHLLSFFILCLWQSVNMIVECIMLFGSLFVAICEYDCRMHYVVWFSVCGSLWIWLWKGLGGGGGGEWEVAWTLLLHKGKDLGVNVHAHCSTCPWFIKLWSKLVFYAQSTSEVVSGWIKLWNTLTVHKIKVSILPRQLIDTNRIRIWVKNNKKENDT